MAKIPPGTKQKVSLAHAKLHLVLQLAKSNFIEREGPQRAIK